MFAMVKLIQFWNPELYKCVTSGKSTFVKLEHPSNELQIAVASGAFIVVKLVQLLNALPLIFVTLGKFILVKLIQSLNAFGSILVTLGASMFTNFQQCSNIP